ncbi:MAG: YidC/Oxa1 family membrane protein insertase, partial [Firmicutes bacterium]|nr:YidC/Oxa1 family membrane protein insertase [Bacillota bacterium]
MLNQILITPPTDGAWPLTRLFINMIESIHSSVLSYAIAILLVVLIIRLVMLPMDVWQRYTQKTMTAGQRKMGPDLAKIQKAYGHDRQLLARKQMDVYRKHGVRPLANLGTMMLNIGLTMFILITMINAINRVSLYKIDDQFAQLNSTFVSSIVLQLKAEDLVSPADVYRLDNASASDKDKIKNEIFLIYFDDITDPMIANAQGVVYNTYQDRRNGLKERFLWIENIWRRDANVAPIPTYAEAEMSGDSRNYFIATFNLNNWATLRDSGILVELIEENPTQIRQWDILGTVIRNNLEDVNTYLTTTDLTINNEPARLFWDSPAGTELTHNTAVIALMQNAANYDATVAYMLTNFQPELMQALTAE